MLLQCAGMIRSGSTLQYNIAKRVLELTAAGEHIHANEDIVRRIRQALDDPHRIYVNKTHKYQPMFLSRSDFASGRAKITMIYRDIRDIVASHLKFKKRSTFAGVMVDLEDWTTHAERDWFEAVPENMRLRVRYEDIAHDIKNHALLIAKFLGLALTVAQAEQIAAELHIERVRQETRKQSNMNAHTHCGVEHVHDGSAGWYREVLTAKQIATIEDRVGDWLTANGYQIGIDT